jgi:uncharacterized protein (TIGR02001 family)
MKHYKLTGLITTLLVASAISPAFAAENTGSAINGNVSAVSTYVWRGQPRTVDAALQGGINISTTEGIHGGAWTSNVSYGVAGSELDFTLGYAGAAKGISYDVGVMVYTFPQHEEALSGDYNFNEIFFSISKDFLNARLSSSADAGNYIEINANFDKVVSNWDLGLHFGSYDVDQDFEGLAYAGGEDYNDYSVSLGTKLDGLDLSFTLSDTNIDNDTYRTIIKLGKDF